MRFDEIQGEEMEEPSELEAAARAIKKAGTLGFSDEIQGFFESRFPRLQLGVGDFFNPSVPTPKATSYEQARDEARRVDDVTREAHPGLSTAVEIGTSVLHPVNRLGGSGLAGAVRGGAGQGAVQGLGESRADLTDGEILEYVRAFGDTAKGAALGGAFGAVGHGVGQGLRALGQKGGQLLDDAREKLFREEAEAGFRELEEQAAPRVAERQAQQVARAKEQARLEREQGQAMEMNKAYNRRTAREAEREARRGTPRSGEAPLLSEEPGTRTLQGYQGSAGERRAVNYDRVQGYRERLQDPELPPAERQRLERYVGKYGDAVDNPGAFERGRIEQELRKRYDRATVDRIMRERVAEDGQIISRGASDKTLPAGWEDVVRQGRAEEAARMGGGGSVWDEYQPKTEVALVRTSPDDGVPNLIDEGNVHTFEFRPQGQGGQAFEVVVVYDPANPGALKLDVVKPLNGTGKLADMHVQAANQVGPAVIKNLLGELAEQFPQAKVLKADRVTGWNPDRLVEMRLPGATRASQPDFSDYEVPHGSPMFRENLAREVEREGLEAPHWQRQREPGERPLTPYENAQLEAQNRRMAPDDDTVPQYGYPPEEQFRHQSALPEADDFALGDAGEVVRPPPLAPPPARLPAGQHLQGFGPRGAPPAAAPARAAPAPVQRAMEPTRAPPRRAQPPAPRLAPELPPTEPGTPPAGAPRLDDDVATVYEYLRTLDALPSSAMQRAGAREANALGQVASAGYEGVKGSGNMLGALAGGAMGITRESIRNPAVRARALSMLRVRKLADVDPATAARVGRTLEMALQQGPDEYAATVHVYNQTDPGFREAERRAGEGMDNLSDEQLEQELRAAGLL